MARKKNLLYALILASVVFLLIQVWSTQLFGNQQQPLAYHQTDFKLGESIKELVRSCRETLQVECMLVDEELLISYVLHQTALVVDSKSGAFGGGAKFESSCGVFCGHDAAAFFVDGDSMTLTKINIFKESLISRGFTIHRDERGDDRELSVEKRTSKHQLVYNLFINRGETFLLVSFAYSRYGRWWSNGCNYALVPPSALNDKWRVYLNKSLFCTHQRLINNSKNQIANIDGIKVSIPIDIPDFIEYVRSAIYTPCVLKNARNFYSEYGLRRDAESEVFRAKAKQLLSLAIRVLGELSVPFWLSSGTCLGWYRQCGFIPHSKDVDIGIWIKHYKPQMVQTFLNRGLKLKHQFGKVEDSFELSFTLMDLKLDIFFFYEDESSMWNGGTQARTGKKFKYTFPKFSLCWTHMSGLTVRVPCPALPYVQANYGTNWNVLVKHWDWKASPPNVRENGEWPVLERKQVIQVF